MRVAALYDIHGNLPALEAVLRDIRSAGVDSIVVGGDIFPGPMARECLECLQACEIPTTFIKGNGDREVIWLAMGGKIDIIPLPVRDIMMWCAQTVPPHMLRTMRAWPPTTRRDIPGVGQTLFCHATPTSDVTIVTERTPIERMRPEYADAKAEVVICGHTHIQFDRMIDSVRVVNAGSVGMPFSEPGAYWLLLGPDVSLVRTDFDLDDAARRIRKTAYPKAASFADNNVLKPPPAVSMLAAFDRPIRKPKPTPYPPR